MLDKEYVLHGLFQGQVFNFVFYIKENNTGYIFVNVTKCFSFEDLWAQEPIIKTVLKEL